MTVSDLLTAVRRQYNAVGDSFFADAEIYDMMYDACMELAIETNCIERTYTTTTVAGTQEYSYPSNVMAVKRLTYDGKKLKVITMREDDSITGLDQTTTSQGTPQYYYLWNDTIALRPIPDAAETLKIWAFSMPSAISSTSTLEVPTFCHLKLINYCISRMAAKDSNPQATKYYAEMWAKDKLDIKKWMQMRRRTDSFSSVQSVDTLHESWAGEV